MSCIAVLGFFRTGSSAVANVLHHLGVFMGDQFDPPESNNAQGFWEDLEFKNLHKQMLDGYNMDQQYIELVRKREQEHPIWGVKDPRLCLLLPNLIKSLSTQWKILHVTRDEQEIETSMIKAAPVPMVIPRFRELFRLYQEWEQRWVEKYSPGLHVDFSEIISDPTGTVQRIADFAEVEVTPEALKAIIPRN
jgi:hypothetical protein